MKFLAGFLTMLFILSVINCSGTMPNKGGGMTIIDHSTIQQPDKQEKNSCVCSDDF